MDKDTFDKFVEDVTKHIEHAPANSTQQELEWALLGCQQELVALRAEVTRLQAQVNEARGIIEALLDESAYRTGVYDDTRAHGCAWLAANPEIKS